MIIQYQVSIILEVETIVRDWWGIKISVVKTLFSGGGVLFVFLKKKNHMYVPYN